MSSPRPARTRRRLAALGIAVALLPGWTTAASRTGSLIPPWLGTLVGEVSVSVDMIDWHGTEIRRLQLPLHLDAGSATIEQGRAEVAGGSVKLRARYGRDGAAALQVQGDQLELGRLGELRRYVDGAPLAVTVDLTAAGASRGALAASLHGRMTARNTGTGSITKSVERAREGLLSGLFSAFTPYRNEDEATVLECLAVDVPVVAGRIEGDLLLELRTRRMLVRGGGSIDLRRGALDLRLRPEPRSAIRLRSLKGVDIVRVHGRLAAPEVDIEMADLIDRAAGLGMDVATFGALLGGGREGLCGKPLPATSPGSAEPPAAE